MTVARRLQRLVEATVTGQLAPRKRAEVVAHLRSDIAVRAEYDRAIEAFRVLEGRDVAEVEYDLVADWLFEATPVAEVTPEARSGWLRFFGVMFALAAGLLLALGPLRPQPAEQDDGFAVKGPAYTRMLAIQALCPDPRRTALGPVRDGLLPAAQDGCNLKDTLSFAYRLDRHSNVVGTLTLFAVDEHGDVLYYQPTPVDEEHVVAVPGPWQPLPIAVRIEVNHEPGGVTLYGLVSPQPPTIDDIDEVGTMLGGAPAPASRAWHHRVGTDTKIGAMCAGYGACESAELSFNIHGAVR